VSQLDEPTPAYMVENLHLLFREHRNRMLARTLTPEAPRKKPSPLMQSFTREDKRISRCRGCGDQCWDGLCFTCRTLNEAVAA